MSLKNFFVFLLITSLLAISFLYTHFFIIILVFIFFLVFVFKKYGWFSSLSLIICFIFFNFYKINQKPNIQEKNIENYFSVFEAKEKYMLVKDNENRYLVYYPENKETYEKKDELYISGFLIEIQKDLDIDVFDFKEYLNKKRVFYQIVIEQVKLVRSNASFNQKIIQTLTGKLKDESYNMTRMLLFNDKEVDIENYNHLKEINALHLFVVSGFHIHFLFSLIINIFKKKKIGMMVAFAFCFFYVYILDFTISSCRALFTLFLSKCFSKFFSTLDCISISGLLFLLIEPLNIYNYSFIMTYIMTFTMVISANIVKNQNKILQAFILSFIGFLAMIPIQLLLNYKINFISLIANAFLSYIVLILFMACLIGMPISIISNNFFQFIYKPFYKIIEQLSNLSTSITFGSLSFWLILLYYILFFFFLYILEKRKLKKSILSFLPILAFMFCLYHRQYFITYQQVTFLNVFQGDCAIIQDSYHGGVMLIDTGGLLNYDIAEKKIMPYLNYHGIREIDMVVITHHDNDHCGALQSLSEKVKIKEIIDDPNIENLKLGKLSFTNLNHYFSHNDNENDQSIVLYGNICSLNFLFTGDISSEIELKIIQDYSSLKVDVLKVAHHGSSTSTHRDFIAFIQPKYAIISVGENNIYGHPSSLVLRILTQYNVEVYRTDEDGTIRFKGKILDKYFIETAK